MKHSNVPSALYAHCSPRSYDVGLLFCIRAINLAWQDAVRARADQAVSQWMLQRVCYFHIVTDEGPNPRRPCPTDVEMQPLRELSSSASPQRTTSASLPQVAVQHGAVSMGHGVLFTPQSDPHAVDFSVIASGGGAECGSDALSLSRISALDSSCQQTPQPERHHFTAARSSGHNAPRGGSTTHRLSSASRGDGASNSVAAADDQLLQLVEGHRHPLHNKGFVAIHELLLLCLDVDERFFCTMVEAFLAVLPRSSTTHAEISLAMFENYPYIAPTPSPASGAGDPPDVLVQASDNAAGNAMKSFLVYMNVAFNAGSFERQCAVLEMCKVWRVWLHDCFSAHIAHAITTGATSSSGTGLSPPRHEGSYKEAAHRLVTSRSILQEGSYDDSSLNVERLVHEAMLSKDVHGVANTVHRFYEHRLGADGTGRAMLEVLLHPTMAPPPPSHPLAFLFGVPPTAAQHHGNRSTAPPPSAEAFPVGGGGGGSTSAHTTDIHAAISCGILTFGAFYLSVRSTAAALRCADMAVLNGHQSGYVDTLALAHLLRSRCHTASGAPGAAAEDISIALQLASPSPTSAQSDWWRARALAFHAASELLIFFPGAVDATLRGALMQNPLGSLDADAGESGSGGGMLRSFLSSRTPSQGTATTDGTNAKSETIEVIQTLAQTVRHTLWCADVALLEECSAGLSFQAVAAVTSNTIRIASTCLGVAPVVPPLSEAKVGATMTLLEEDRLVMPEVRISCSANTVVLEYAKQAVVGVVQQLLGEYDPSPAQQMSEGARNMPAPRRVELMLPFEALLRFVANKDGHTNVLDRCFYFSIAVEVAASYALFANGYVVLANTRIGGAMRQLLEPQLEAAGGMSAPHWPYEGLLLLVASAKLHVDVLLFLGCVDLAQRTVDTARGIFRQCMFARGIMQCHLLQASIWQSQRNRAEQVRLLTFARDAAREIGLLPMAAAAHLKLVAAHLAAGDLDSARDAQFDSSQQQLTHLLRRDASSWLLHRIHTVVTSTSPHASAAERRKELSLVEAVHDELRHQRARGMLPFTTDLSVSHTVATFLRAHERDKDTTKSRVDDLIATSHHIQAHVKRYRNTDFMRGLGDNLSMTCECITSLLAGATAS